MAIVSRPVKAPAGPTAAALAAVAACCSFVSFFSGSESTGFIIEPAISLGKEGLNRRSSITAPRTDAFLAPDVPGYDSGSSQSSKLGAVFGAAALLALAGASSTRKRVSTSSPIVVASNQACDASAAFSSVTQATSSFTGTGMPTVRPAAAGPSRCRGPKVRMKITDKQKQFQTVNQNRRRRIRALWFQYSAHMKGRKADQYRLARRAVMKALAQKYDSRKLFKRERRKLWIMRVRANARLHGISYSTLICKLKEADILVNRKILSQLGVYDRPVFSSILEVAIPNWREVREYRLNKTVKKEYTHEQLDNVFIPYMEKMFPDIYTDATIRFNRKMHDWGVEYTVDAGDPKMWQEVLPKMPELQNFNLPDHWCGNLNAETEFLPVEYWDWGNDMSKATPIYQKFLATYRKKKDDDYEAKKRGEPGWPTKDGVSREDWYKEEPQSWFE